MESKKISIERRNIVFKELRVIENTENTNRAIEGYAAVFDSWSESLGGKEPFVEKVCKGAFEKTIQEDDIRALFNHDPNYVLGRNKAGTLSLLEDEKGLFVRIVPPDTQWARDLLVSINRGDITQMSFGFTVELDKWFYENDKDVRELLKVKLFDVSPVTFPAYTQTECSVRSKDDVYDKYKEKRMKKEQTDTKSRKIKLERMKQKIKFI